MPRRAILTINEDKLVLYEDEELQEAEDALRKESSGSRKDGSGGSLPTMNAGLHSLAEFFVGLRTLRAEQDGSGSCCKLVTGDYDDALAAIGVVEDTPTPPAEELNTLFALRDFLRETLKTSELAELHLAVERGNAATKDIESGRASPTEGKGSGGGGGGKKAAEGVGGGGGGGGGANGEVQDVPPDPFGGDVNMNAVACKLSELAALLGDVSLDDEEEARSRRSSVDFYESENGNDALASGMFDLAVVVEELSPQKKAAAAAADGESAGGGAQAGAPVMSKPMPRGVTLLSMDDNYRPRTSSKAKEPVFDAGASKAKPKQVSLLSTDNGYRPRTSSNAKAKDPDGL